MKKPKDRDDDENPLSRPNLNGNIEFKNVTFLQVSMNLLLKVSFKIKSGERVAILGRMVLENQQLQVIVRHTNLM